MTLAAVADEETLDALTAGWRIIQRKKGHRHSTDDLLTGWYAAEHAAVPPQRILDLGAGLGSVGLLALWRAPATTTLVAIEAQDISFGLLVRNVELNGLGARVRAIHGDLRAVRIADESLDGRDSLPAGSAAEGRRGVVDLVTGSPPYWDVSAGIVPADSQKAHARFELRGTVRDYAAAARAAMAAGPDSRFVFCFPAVQRARAEAAVAEAGLAVVRSRDVIPRVGAAALFSLFACAHAEAWHAAPVLEPPHAVRDADGAESAAHAAARATFGLGGRARVSAG